MKKAIVTCAVALALVSFMNWANTYTMGGCEVVNVSGSSVTVRDKCGNLWDLEADGFSDGDLVEMKMNGKGTDFIDDDEVLDIWEAKA